MDKSELIEEFSKCRKNLERYAVSLTGNIKDAEDLVSDLCIAILERNTDVEEIRFPKAFFKTSLRHRNKRECFLLQYLLDAINRK